MAHLLITVIMQSCSNAARHETGLFQISHNFFNFTSHNGISCRNTVRHHDFDHDINYG